MISFSIVIIYLFIYYLHAFDSSWTSASIVRSIHCRPLVFGQKIFLWILENNNKTIIVNLNDLNKTF